MIPVAAAVSPASGGRETPRAATGSLQIAQVGAKATSFQDSNRMSGRWYRYRVRAFNAQGSGYSNIASAKAPREQGG